MNSPNLTLTCAAASLVAACYGPSSPPQSSRDVIFGTTPLAFSELMNAFKSVCMASAPSFRTVPERLHQLGAIGRSISGSYVHPDTSLRGNVFSVDAESIACDVSAEVYDDRLEAERLFETFVGVADQSASSTEPGVLVSVSEGTLRIYSINESISTGRSTMSLITRYL